VSNRGCARCGGTGWISGGSGKIRCPGDSSGSGTDNPLAKTGNPFGSDAVKLDIPVEDRALYDPHANYELPTHALNGYPFSEKEKDELNKRAQERHAAEKSDAEDRWSQWGTEDRHPDYKDNGEHRTTPHPDFPERLISDPPIITLVGIKSLSKQDGACIQDLETGGYWVSKPDEKDNGDNWVSSDSSGYLLTELDSESLSADNVFATVDKDDARLENERVNIKIDEAALMNTSWTKW
jgi:hypothetical protein